MPLIGQWLNSYGSILDIRSQEPSGAFTGLYGSHTGTTGIFPVNGIAPLPPHDARNQPLSFCVSWKPVGQDVEDPSWHWVSVMSGVLYYDAPAELAAQPRIEVLHGLVASTPARAAQRLGVYAETLAFEEVADVLADYERPAEAIGPNERAPSTRLTLLNIDNTSRFRRLSLDCSAEGWVDATVDFVTGQTFPARGFLDPSPEAPRRSLALSLVLEDQSLQSVTLGGLVDLESGTATLERFDAEAVPYKLRYTAVTLGQETFSVSEDS